MSERGVIILLCLATALASGLVIGAEREQGRHATFGGVRTFPMFALAGALGALISVWLLVALALTVSAFLIVAYLRETDPEVEEDPEEREDALGLSSEMAALATFALGALTTTEGLGVPLTDRLLLVGAGTTAVLALLALKRRLHAFVSRVSKEDVYATAKLMLLAIVVLPVMPSSDLGPWGALNPQSIGVLVVLIGAIGFAGYVAIRIFGARKGLGLTGLLGGLASSTAVTLTFSGRAKESPALVDACAVAIVLASSTMFPRLAVELAAVSPELALRCAWPLAAAFAAGLAGGGVLYLRLSRETRAEDPPLELKNPLTLASSFKFAALFTAVLLLSKGAAHYLQETGVLLSALVTGLADADAISLSVARMVAQGALDEDPAVAAVGIATASNTCSKVGIAGVLGGPKLALRVGVPLGLALAAGGAAVAFTG